MFTNDFDAQWEAYVHWAEEPTPSALPNQLQLTKMDWSYLHLRNDATELGEGVLLIRNGIYVVRRQNVEHSAPQTCSDEETANLKNRIAKVTKPEVASKLVLVDVLGNFAFFKAKRR